jgi:endonuclease/exonuclease/phosphatase family metal-dependent hydrolase
MILSLLLTIFTLVELNCENLFDTENDSLKQDEEFTPEGLFHWTHARYWKKINHIGQEIVSCGEQADGTYSIPDLVALCEVENDSVLRDLTQRSMLRNANYEYVVTDSPDERGIDVGLLYSPFTFGYIKSYAIRVTPLKNMKPTRDILYVEGRTAAGDTLHVFVVHAPSRSGGEFETRPHRAAVTQRLAQSVDSIKAACAEPNIIVAGDFNDPHDGHSMRVLYDIGLVDISKNACGRHGAKASYKYKGEWESIDHVFVSINLSEGAECSIHDAPFLMCKDEQYGGIMPFRNYQGIRWRNGFSDHLPIVARINLPKNF